MPQFWGGGSRKRKAILLLSLTLISVYLCMGAWVYGCMGFTLTIMYYTVRVHVYVHE